MEDPRNIGLVCAEHAPVPNPVYKERDPQSFVGKFVKRVFAGGPRLEHMWVKVIEVKDGELSGELNNDPVSAPDLVCGMTVRVRLDQIEDVCD